METNHSIYKINIYEFIMIRSKISKITRDRISPVLLKGKSEGAKQAITHGECFAKAIGV
jgi:hypothetical protein